MALPRMERKSHGWVVRTTCGVYVIPSHACVRRIEWKYDSIRVGWEGGEIWVYHGSRGDEREKLYKMLVETLLP